MSISELTDADAVRRAIREHDARGEAAFLADHHFGVPDRYYVRLEDRLYGAKVIAGVAYGYQFPERGTLPHGKFSGGNAAANRVLRRLGFEIVDTKPDTVEGERQWRLAVGAHLRAVNKDGHGLEPWIVRGFRRLRRRPGGVG